jgi:photoactive yellow protein
MTDPALPHFDAADLAQRVEQLTPDVIDALPFGAVRLGASGDVQFYSRREAELSGYGRPIDSGTPFFTQIAPCMNTPRFWGRIQRAMAHRDFDVELIHVGDFADRQRRLRVRALPSSGGGVWLFHTRDL